MISWLNKLAQKGVFFKLKNDELKVLTKAQAIDKALLKEIKKRKKEIKTYLKSQTFASEERSDFQSIPVIDQQESYPLSDAQKRLYIASKLEDNNVTYNIPSDVYLTKEYDINILERAIYEVVKRHEILRTVFRENQHGEIRQWIIDFEELNFTIDYLDFTDDDKPNAKARNYLEEQKKKAFDLHKGPLFRVSIIQFTHEINILHFNIHHIISDEWSEEILKRDILAFYDAFSNNLSPNIPDLKIQYKDYTVWKQNQKDKAPYKKSRAFWMNQLKGDLPIIGFPEHKKRPSKRTNNGAKLSTRISPKLTKKLNEFSKEKKISLFTFLLTVINITFHKYTSNRDIIIGTAVSGREHGDLDDQIGFFVNTLVLRNKIKPGSSFTDFLEGVSQNTKNAFSHQEYPFDHLVGDLQLDRDLSRHVLFDVSLVLHNRIEDPAISEDDYESIEWKGETLVKLDMEVAFTEINDYIRFDLNYYKKVYDRDMVESFIHHFKRLLELCLDAPDTSIAEMDYLSKGEKHLLLKTFNETKTEYETDKTVLDFFHSQVEKTPNAPAISFENESLTFKQLDTISNQLANYLISKGVEKETLIPLCLERSLKTVISILGILKAGAAYVPIDPNYPQQRIDFILDDTGAKFLVTQANLMAKFENRKEDLQLIVIDKEIEKIQSLGAEKPEINVTPKQLIYVIYTSGTTGKPKGVLCVHKGVLNLALTQIAKMKLSDTDKTLQFASVSFDAFGFELYASLLSGGQLFMLSEQGIKSRDKIEFLIQEKGITVATLPPSYQVVLNKSLKGLRLIVSAGEALNIAQTKKLQDLGVQIINGYGPTENSVCTTMSLSPIHSENTATIGKPLNNVQVYVLNENSKLVPIGVTGELCTSGSQLAVGYLNRSELTEEKFIPHPFIKGEKLYRTGDLVRWLPDGNLEFAGRKDDQVKIRGYRVELEEIETQLLQIEEIAEASVLVKTFGNDQKQLVAYITSSEDKGISYIEEKLKQVLPEYMVPSTIISVEKMPLTINGKIDKKALLQIQKRSEIVTVFNENNEIESKLLSIWSKLLEKEPATINRNTGFFQMGGNSLLIMEMQHEIKHTFSIDVPIESLFQNATVALQLQLLRGESNTGPENTTQPDLSNRPLRSKEEESTDIAVIGMAIKTPGAKNIEQFWNILKNGKEPLKYFTDEELERVGVSKNTLDNEAYVKAGFFLDGKEYFDSSFFGYLPDEAKLMDPQTRIFHEVIWEGLEDAGCDPLNYDGSIGLFAGLTSNLNWEVYSMLNNDGQKVNSFTAAQLQNKDFANSLIAYKLNLKGGVYKLNTACSTSLVAIHRAVESLLSGENQIAMAGGISLKKNFDRGYYFQEGMINSKDAHNKAFDNDSSGTVESEGAGVVVLKKLKDAIKDGDNIVAVIKGSAINNDGNRKAGYTAPSLDGQKEVIKKAQQVAGIQANSISYVETHGTATRLGDVIEFEALTQVFDRSASKFCAIGTVKSNLGHMDTAAGVAGFIKTVLCLKNKKLVPSLHFTKPNANLSYDASPFYVNTEFKEWSSKENNLLRAGVSSFGIGGTNAHVVVEEFLSNEEKTASNSDQIIVLSAKNQEALKEQKENLKKFTEQNKNQSINNIAWTLQAGRKSFSQRACLLVNSTTDLIDKLDDEQHIVHGVVKEGNKKIVFMFPGQGTQYLNMGRGLYESEGVVKEVMDQCFEIISSKYNRNLKELLFTENEDASIINQTKNTQLLLFIFEYALAKQLQHYGIQPDVMIGHSIGEYAAACISGVLSLEDTLRLVLLRGEMIQGLPKGAMISINLSAEEVEPFLNDSIDIAAINTGQGCVLSGDFEAIAEFKKQLDDFEISYKDLHTSHAFHSQMMMPVAEEFTKEVRQITRNAPTIPYISNVTGKEISGTDIHEDDYWFNHIRKTVRFADGLQTIFKINQDLIFIEVGPSKTLSNFVRQNKPQTHSGVNVVNLVRHPKEVYDDSEYFLRGLGTLWTKGTDIQWSEIHGENKPRKTSLPTYPFAKIKYPIGADLHKMIAERMTLSNTAKLSDTSKWFYKPSWHSDTIILTNDKSATFRTSLIFMDAYGYGDNIINKLDSENKTITVFKGLDFEQKSQLEFIVNPENEAHYKQLFEQLKKQKTSPDNVLNLWSIDEEGNNGTKPAYSFSDYYNSLFLAKGIVSVFAKHKIHLTMVTNKSCQIIGNEKVKAEKALMNSIALVIAQENPTISMKCIDITLKDDKSKISEAIIHEMKGGGTDKFIGYRFNKRWLKKYTPLMLRTPEKEQVNIRPGGVYLITGGLGALGLLYAEYLLKNYNASILLIGRTKLKDNDLKKKQLAKLEASGNVLYVSADISNEAKFASAVEKGESEFGKINGVIHAAGFTGKDAMKAIYFTTKEVSEKHFAPKIKGTYSLINIFKDYELDFCLFTSSLAGITGGKEVIDYAAANIYLDTISNLGSIKNSISVNYDGLNFNNETYEYGMNQSEAILVLEKILSCKAIPQIVVSVGDLEHRMQKNIQNPVEEKMNDAQETIQELEINRNHLTTAYAAPLTTTEKDLRDLLVDFFGMKGIGILDDFFELGGDSLKAMSLANSIHKKFNIELGINDFFINPTIKGLAKKIDTLQQISQDKEVVINTKYEDII